MQRPTVIIRACPDYDVSRIQTIIREGLELLNLRPHGRTLVKPNIVASGPQFPHAYTRPEFMEGVLRALKERAAPDLTEIAVGERCGITIPTRHAFKGAGYYQMAKRVGNVKLYHFEEVTQVEVPLYHDGRLRDSFFTPEPVAKADFFVNCPKFKAHPWTTVTFSMKNYIGIQDDRHRLIDHDHKLNEKVADLQYIIQPQFIAIDGIVAGEGRMLTPIPFDLKLIIMGNNQVAFDAVCCQIVGLDPLSVDHIRMAWERGFGPVELSQIDLRGDLSLTEARARAQGFRTGLIRVEDYFKGTNIRAYAGPPPNGAKDDYCWGGCPGAIEEAIEILRQFDSGCDDRIATRKPLHVVFGAYNGPIHAAPDEKIVFMGDCTEYKGIVGDNEIDLRSLYVDRSSKNPHEAQHDDIYSKMASVWSTTRKSKDDQVVRIKGCPVSVAEQILVLVFMMRLKDPFTSGDALPFNMAYFSWRLQTLIQRMFGTPYQKAGPTARGKARPHQNLPLPQSPVHLELKV